MSSNLVYFTVGFNLKYLEMLYLALKSLRKRNTLDVLVICDEQFMEQCSEKLEEFSNLTIVPCTNSTSAPDSSMKKLLIFNYDVLTYKKILFIDSDVLVGRNLDYFFQLMFENKLYAGAEEFTDKIHESITHSLKTYSDKDLNFFRINAIYGFNCGFFGLLNNIEMRTHFTNILEMIRTHVGEYYYEQSFMNVYFNLRNLTDTKVMNESNYKFRFFPEKVIQTGIIAPFHKNKVVHFAWCRGAENKLFYMKKFWNLFVE
jgi:lipopolysaccharide biosynthesis glycosyltransferase